MDSMDDDTLSGATSEPVSAPPSNSTTRSRPHAALDPDVGPSTTAAAAGLPPSHKQLSKRRRGIGVVTPNACNECRKKRVKCDGRKPCGRCRMQRDVECIYELPVRQSKEDLRTEIENLRRRQRSSETVLSALGRIDVWEEVLQRLRNGETVDNISEWLDGEIPPQSSQDRTPTPGVLPSPFGRPVVPKLPTNSGDSFSAFSPVGLPSLSPVVHDQAMPGIGGLGGSGGSGAMSSHMEHQQPLIQPHLQRYQQHAQPPPHHQPHQHHTNPWGSQPYSAASQAASTGVALPQSRVGLWVENISSHHERPPSELSRYRGLEQILGPNTSDKKVLASTWTDVTADSTLVLQLLSLFFVWEYPVFASLSKEHFLQDFHDGRQRYCSPILVNALLALGCRFSTQPSSRAIPDDPYSSGDHFFKECQRLLYLEEEHHTLTTIQAIGIMSIREASCGRDSESWYYAGQSIRLALEMGLHRVRHDSGDEDEIAVQTATFWGAFALDHAWSLATGSLPQCSWCPILPSKPAIIDDIEAFLWIPYTDDGAPLQLSFQQPSNVRSVYKCFCELSELVHQSLYILYSPGRPLTSRELLNMYTQYLNWYDSIPEVLRLGHNFTPAVLFAHMYYHFAILLLFRPLIKLRIIGSSIRPIDVCLQAADAIQGLLRSYSQLYTLKRTPSFVPYFVLTASIMHLAIEAASTTSESENEDRGGALGSTSQGQGSRRNSKVNPRLAESIHRGIADLTEMVPCHHFAEQALSILRHLAKKWNIDVHNATVVKTPGGGVEEVDNDRTVRPLTSSLNFFAPRMWESDFNCAWGSSSTMTTAAPRVGLDYSKGGMASEYLAEAPETQDNPLFWPFPMQGRPMLPSGQKLEEAGFAML